MKLKRSLYNIAFGLLSQLIILSLGLIIPRLFLLAYGSEVNGLFSSVGQIFGYVALLEAGIGAATIQVLYKPVVAGDKSSINHILSATKKYYKKVSFYYFACIVVISLLYPMLIHSNINKLYIGFIVFLQGLSGVINFYFQATLKQLLLAEGKNYIETNVSMMTHIITSFARVFLILSSANIVLIQLVYLLTTILEMLFYYFYFKKKYPWLYLHAKPDFSSLQQKNAFLIHQISGLIFSSTDMLLLSFFCSFKVVSVYAIYNLIFVSLNTLVGTLHNGVSFALGHTYHENKQEYLKLHDAYDHYYITFIFSIISLTYILIEPFMKIYTNGINDIDYIDSYLPFLFCTIQLLTCTRIISNNLIRIAGHMKKTIPNTIIESCINLSISLLLVQDMGLYGVLIGTICALLYRTTDIIFYANQKIINRSPIKIYKTIGVNCGLFSVVVFLNARFVLQIGTYFDFIKIGLLLSAIIIPIYFIINSILSMESFRYVYKKIQGKLILRS